MTHHNKAQSVLKAWQAIEFFQPYDLPAEPDKRGEARISLDRKQSMTLEALPWRNAPSPGPGYEYRYTLYLGVFDKRAATEELRRSGWMAMDPDDSAAAVDEAERIDDEGPTCLAKVNVNHAGEIDYDSLSISTLPWALGRLRRHQGKGLDPQTLADSREKLEEQLNNHRNDVFEQSDGRDGTLRESELGTKRLRSLLALLWNWADYDPTESGDDTDQSSCAISTLVVDCQVVRKKKAKGGASGESQPEQQPESEQAQPASDTGDEAQDGDDERQMPILNSFFINDLQNAYSVLARGRGNTALASYLEGMCETPSPDLYTAQGLRRIQEKLSHRNMPAGRWPSNPQHPMSLMQQCAINIVSTELPSGGIRSVNGPPGTGKTTMLRDIIADNLVQRAMAMAKLPYAGHGLTEEGLLHESLTGYEMVVASANNAAVENISEEIPSIDAVDPEAPQMDYLSGVANALKVARTPRLVQTKPNGKKSADAERVRAIATGEDRCWGLMAGVGGRKANLTTLKDGLFFHPADAIIERDDGTMAAGSIWQWRKYFNGPSFKQACKDFRAKLDEYEQLMADIDQFHADRQTLKTLSRETPPSKERFDQYMHEQLASHREQIKKAKEQAIEAKNGLIDSTQVSLREYELSKLRSQRPNYGRLKAWWKSDEVKAHERKIEAKASELEQLKSLKTKLDQKFQDAARHHEECRKAYSRHATALSSEWQRQWDEHEQQKRDASRRVQFFCQRFGVNGYGMDEPDLSDPGVMLVPDPPQAIDDPQLQRKAYYQHKRINRTRTEVFKAALAVHESWLHEALDKKRFRDQVWELGDSLDNPGKMTLELWQILFMMVPVVSTTFSALGRMLSKVPADGIGWMLIDESGQAPPQQAVGALRRAKRGVIVGDPQQIEPVVTTSPSLIEQMMATLPADERRAKNPAVQSVQTLADAANPYGCVIEASGGDKRIGIPLWVHRRCLDPMFSVSNEIAYDNRMVHGSDAPCPEPHPVLGRNTWIDSTNHGTGNGSKTRQYIPAQGEILVEMLRRYLAAGGDESELFVISPFKAVKQGLRELVKANATLLGEAAAWGEIVADTPEVDAQARASQIRKWASDAIGTVHTFQGRENRTVILVLGCDSTNKGAVSWAGSAPNILNVAVTRAKKNLFVIGPRALWRQQGYFARMAQNLEVAYSVDEVLDDPVAPRE